MPEDTITRIFAILDDIRDKLSGVLVKMEERERTEERTEKRLDEHEERLSNLEKFQANIEGQQKDTHKASRDWVLIFMTAVASIASVVALIGR